MPPNAFKIFIFLLLRVNHSPTQDCDVGEGWIDYEEIRRYCSEKGRGKMSNATISAALDYLERRGYIKRYREKNGVAQKIRVVNYRKYQAPQGFEAQTCLVSKQGATSSVSKQVSTPCGTSNSGTTCLEIEQPHHETKQKQEYSYEEEEIARLKAMVRWFIWFMDEFTYPPPRGDFEDIERLRARGLNDDLIIAVMAEAKANRRVRYVTAWSKRRLAELLARGIRTAEEYARWKEELARAQTTRRNGAQPPTAAGNEKKINEVKEALRRLQHEQERQNDL